jgi:hypothetical protein
MLEAGARKGVVWTAAWICIHRYRKSFHRLLTSKRLTDITYVQAPHVLRRTAFAPLEAVRSSSDFVVSHGRARRRRYPPDELSISIFTHIGVPGRFYDLAARVRTPRVY